MGQFIFRSSVVAGGSNNPDGITAATTTYYTNDYSTEVAEDVDEGGAGHVTMEWNAAYGYTGGGWRAIPQPISSDVHEDNAGWAGFTSPSVDETDILCTSYMLYISSALLADIASPPDPSPNTQPFWGHGNKIIDATQWATDGSGPSETDDHRWVIKVRMNGGLVRFSHLSGGAGAEFYDDGVNTNPDLVDLADEWFWVMHVMDATALTCKTFIKRSGGNVTKVLEKEGPDGDPGDRYLDSGRGWYGNGYVWGYWDDMTNATPSATKYVALDRLRITNGWVDPPF